jgi:general secretion pathway protein D
MKSILVLFITFAISICHAEGSQKWYFNNEELSKIIEMYSSMSGQKFIIDPGVRGKVSIFNQGPISTEEAFNQLSSALAINGFGISKQGDTMIIKSARNIQRDLIEVSSEVPSLKPERIYTWIYTAKNIPVTEINRDFRILLSKDGESNIIVRKNQIIFTDWASNLNRVASIMKQIDTPVSPEAAKLAALSLKENQQERKERQEKKSKQE